MTTDPTRTAIGKIAAPLRSESTTTRCFFWAPGTGGVEKTQLVRTQSEIAGETVTFYGVVEEVYRRSRKRDFEEEVDTFDGDLAYEPPFKSEGVTFAEVTILATDPDRLLPPLEQSTVYLANEEDAARTYGFDEMLSREDGVETDWSLPVGLLRNGAAGTAGVARIDLRDLTGDRAGHLNVTGQAGRGTKSSFLLVLLRSLVHHARALDQGNARRAPLVVRPIVFNVKGNDLMYIDQPNRLLPENRPERWQQLGIPAGPFHDARFLAPSRTGSGRVNRAEPRVQRATGREAATYYWTLKDVLRFGLWTYLFSDAAQSSEALMALVEHVLGLLTRDVPPSEREPAGLRPRERHDGVPIRLGLTQSQDANGPTPEELQAMMEVPQSFKELRDWLRLALRFRDHPARDGGVHTFGTCRALLSRLGLVLDQEGRSIFDAEGESTGHPLDVTGDSAWRVVTDDGERRTADPIVIDIAALPTELRRFVVAAVLDQVKAHQMSDTRIRGGVYFLVLDELGIYAPRGARDPITRLFEHVAAQLRSQGIILLGAQQHASQVSETIFGNSEFKVLGGSSPVELESPTWNRLLSAAQKDRALRLRPEEKMVLTGRGWMNVAVPFPAWAMKESEAARGDLAPTPSENGHTQVESFGFLPPRD